MKSMFVTLPMLIFANFIPVTAIKKYWIFIVVMIVSFLMVAGPQSPFWQAVTSFIPALKLSRFPSSDYRVFIVIPIIILGTAGLRAIIERGLSWKEFLARAAFVVAWFLLGVFSLYSSVDLIYLNQISHVFVSFELTAALSILAATILLIIYYLRKSKSSQNPPLANMANKSIILCGSGFILIVLLISADGLRVVSDMQTWNERPFNEIYLNWKFPLEKNGKFITYGIFENIPNERPARETTDPIKDPHGDQLSWRGYLNGSFMMEDNADALLLARSRIESNGVYRNYMLLKWTPILLDPNFSWSSEPMKITLPAAIISNRMLHQSELCSKFSCDSAFSKSANNQVVQTHYGINDIVYQITLKQPKLMVENEIYFPGWEADLIFPNKKLKLEASEANGVFRSWHLPAGDYKMIANFHFPNLLAYQSISIVSFAIWIFIIIRYWRPLTVDKRMKKKEFLTKR